MPPSVRAEHRFPVYVACSALAIITAALLGKEMAWDTLNYHFYAGFAAVHDRFHQDYFAAGPQQSYFNPYIYLPFYLLASSGLVALWVSMALATVHSVVLWLTYEIALCVCPFPSGYRRLCFGLCAVLLAYLNPILMQQLGTSFADITTAIPVLTGWLLLIKNQPQAKSANVIYAGLALGIASGLKLTNLLHAAAGIVVLIFFVATWRQLVARGLQYGLGLVGGFFAVAAPWALRLLHIFQNPFFPLLNGLFRSPYFTTAPLRDLRFVPRTILEAVWRPFAIVAPLPMVHEELRAPDVRYAALFVLCTFVLIRFAWLRVTGATVTPVRFVKENDGALWALGCAFVCDWTVWVFVSGNGRYFLPMSAIAAVVFTAVLFRALARRAKILVYSLLIIFGVQFTQLAIGANFRWNGAAWGGEKWFDVAMPDKLASQSNLYLTIGTQSNSFLAPFFAKGSGLINFSGGYALGAADANGARISALIQRYSPRVRMLMRGSRLYLGDDRHRPSEFEVDEVLARFSLHVDASDCQKIAVDGLPPDLRISLVDNGVGLASAQTPSQHTDFISCRVIPGIAAGSVDSSSQGTANAVLDKLEDACPELLQPRRMLTEHVGNQWRRLYFNTDMVAWVNQYGWVQVENTVRGGHAVYLGEERDWLRQPSSATCALHGAIAITVLR